MTLKKASDFTDVIGKSSLLSVFLRATVHIICFHRKISQLSGNFSSYKTNSTSSCLTIKLQLWLVPSVKKTLNLTQTRTWLVSQNGSERALSALVGIKDPIIFRRLSDSRIYRVSITIHFPMLAKFLQHWTNVVAYIADLPTTVFRIESWNNFCLVSKGALPGKPRNFAGNAVCGYKGGAANAHMYFPGRENRREKTVESLSANRERRRRWRARLPPPKQQVKYFALLPRHRS